MLDVLEVQNQLKNFSQEQLLKEMKMPSGSVPQFLVLSELNRRRVMSQDMAKRQSADQPTVKEEVVASSGMPMQETSMLAQQMAPQTSMTENTGIASMMGKELPSEPEEPMKMSYGGMLMGSRMLNQMAAPLARDMMYRPPSDRRIDFENRLQQGRGFRSGLDNLGRDISGRVQNRTQEEVDNFIGEVDNMAQERFEVNLSEPSQRQRDMQSFLSGKGQPQPRMAMKDGGAIKAKNGMFADIGNAIRNIDNTTGLSSPFTMSPPDTKLFASSMQPSGVTSFAGVYNFIRTNFPNMSEAEARRQATEIVKTQQEGDIPRLDVTVNKGLPAPDQKLFAGSLGTDPTFDQFKIKPQKYIPPSSDGVSGGVDFDATAPNISSVGSGLGSIPTSLDNALSSMSDSSGQPVNVNSNDFDNQLNKLNALKTKGDIRNLQNKELQRIASMAALDNFSGGAEMSDLVSNLGKGQVANQAVNQQEVSRSSYDPTIYGESEEELAAQMFEKSVPQETEFIPYAFGYKPKTFGGKLLQYGAGAGSGTANLLLGNYPAALTKNVVSGASNILRKPLKADGTAYTQEEIDQSLAKYVGLPSSMVDDFNKNISKELKDKAKTDKETMDNFTGGEEADKLTKEINKKEKEKKEAKEKAGDAGGLGGLGGASGALSELSAQIAELKEKREKGRDSEKWFSLAKLGLGMLASASPTVFGALGEGGLKALEDFKAGKKAYDDDILGYLKTEASIAKSQAELGLKGLVAQKQIAQLKNKKTGTYGVKEIFDDIAKLDERLQKYAGAEFTIKSEDDLKEINRLRTRRLQLSSLLPAGLRPIEVDKITKSASTS